MTAIIRWLLVGVLLCSPFAIAQHQLDHVKQFQTTEHCDVCAHIQSVEPDIFPTTYHLSFHSKQSDKFKPNPISDFSFFVVTAFHQRAPPINK
tara:strand:+ start:221 stop:499 length:279 start_codon:yes stop_codon:yes gene_type:complete